MHSTSVKPKSGVEVRMLVRGKNIRGYWVDGWWRDTEGNEVWPEAWEYPNEPKFPNSIPDKVSRKPISQWSYEDLVEFMNYVASLEKRISRLEGAGWHDAHFS